MSPSTTSRAGAPSAGRGRPEAPRPFRSFGWTLAGILGLSLSLPPVGFYPLAWVALVPLLIRWSEYRAWAVCAREVYALGLTLSGSAGFWLLFHADTSLALAGGLGILLAPLPFTAAVTLSGLVRRRFGLVVGVGALVLTILSAEFLLLLAPVDVPWLLLGHTQVEALPFIQTADVGGVLLLSLWVLLLNVAAYTALPAAGAVAGAVSRIGESGVAVALFAVLIALPAAYGAARTAWAEAPAGYTRLGLVQPGVGPTVWDDRSPSQRVDALAQLSDGLLGRGTPSAGPGAPTVAVAAAGTMAGPAVRPPSRSASGGIGLLLWPQGAVPYFADSREESVLLARLGEWSRQRGVALLTGASMRPADGSDDEVVSALLFTPGRAVQRYDQMRRVPVVDAPSVLGERRALFPVGSARVAPLLGFESLFGDHVRRFALDGADLFVVLAQSDRWGRSSGLYQHLLFTRLRAIETRRAVVVTSVGGVSALIQPSGAIEEAAGWREESLVPLDVPLFREQTVYAEHGDWVGRLAVVAAALLYLICGVVFAVRPVRSGPAVVPWA